MLYILGKNTRVFYFYFWIFFFKMAEFWKEQIILYSTQAWRGEAGENSCQGAFCCLLSVKLLFFFVLLKKNPYNLWKWTEWDSTHYWGCCKRRKKGSNCSNLKAGWLWKHRLPNSNKRYSFTIASEMSAE